MMQGTKYIAVAGVAGAALVLLRRAMRSSLVTGRNRLKLLTPVPEDIEISQAVKLTPVRELFYNAFGLTDEHLFSHGLFKGKLSLGLYDKLAHKPDGHYVVVVGINPTPLGELTRTLALQTLTLTLALIGGCALPPTRTLTLTRRGQVDDDRRALAGARRAPGARRGHVHPPALDGPHLRHQG
jgi:hypothetical protein